MKVIQLTLALLALVAVIECNIVLTGDAEVDFNPNNGHFTNNEKGAIGKFVSENDFYIDIQYMADRNRESGMDVKQIHAYYDWKNDDLYVGIECKGICGDTDGNTNPSTVDAGLLDEIPTFGDDANGCSTESFSIQWWNNIPEDYNSFSHFNFFFPQFITADSLADCIDDGAGNQGFIVYEMKNWKSPDLEWDTVKLDRTGPAASAHSELLRQPDQLGQYDAEYKYSNVYPELPPLELYAQHTSSAAPHIEFILRDFSKYPGNEYMTAGVGKVRIGLRGFFFATSDDPLGEDYITPKVWQFTYDCAGVPNGPNVYDECGICGGHGESCADCAGTPNGDAEEDECGVCNGDGSTCKCSDYLGFELGSVDYALLRWSVSASLMKINDTLEVLKSIRRSLRHYDYENGDVSLNDYIDVIHDFCDDCLDSFDSAQSWFSEVLSGACDGGKCESPFDTEEARWSL